jgi:hypothetical protein
LRLAEAGRDDHIIVTVALAERAGVYFFFRRRGGV